MIVTLQLAFTTENFQAVLDQWGEAGIALFQQTMWLDYLFPIAYAVFLGSAVARLTIRKDEAPSRRLPLSLTIMPFVAALCDYTENTLHLIILANPADLSAPLVLLASVAAAIKWLLIVVVFWGIIYFLASRLRGRV